MECASGGTCAAQLHYDTAIEHIMASISMAVV
jgi:hypothetical protein